MTSEKITLTINDYTFEIDLKSMVGHLALTVAGLLIFGLWPVVIFNLIAVAARLLEWETPCSDDSDSDKPKHKRKNSELLAAADDDERYAAADFENYTEVRRA